MKLRVKPTRWSCLATSFAMAIGTPVSQLFAEIGHDGSEIIHPCMPDPACRRGHHVQECIEVCLKHNLSVTPIELFPVTDPLTVVYFGDEAGNWRRFLHHLETSRGVITGTGHRCGHAVAYAYGQVFDPDGESYEYSREACESRGFITRCLWRCDWNE